jgi:methyl-accepting chemotaxis protein
MATNYKLRITANDQTKGGFNSVNRNINATQTAMKKLAGAFAGVFAVQKIVAFSNETLRLADDLGKTADKLGLATDFLQRMQFAAEQTGIATNTLNMGLQRFTRRVAEARNGTGEAKAALEQLGISLNDSEGNARSIEDVLKDVSDGLLATKDSGEKVRLAFKFFDSEGVALVSTLGQGSEALDKLMRSATGVIPEETIRQAEIFNDTMNELRREVLLPLQKVVIATSNTFLDLLDAMGLVERRKTLSLLKVELADLETQLDRTFDVKGLLGGSKILDALGFTTSDVEGTKSRIEEIKKEIEKLTQASEKFKFDTDQLGDKSNFTNFQTNVEESITVVKQFADTIEGQLTGAFQSFFDFTNKEFLDFKNLAMSVARAVINELIQVFIIEKMVSSIKGSISGFGGFFDSKSLDFLSTLGLSGEGGGFTGYGVRAGGVDGRGGFPMIVHPNETIIDHTKGQSAMGGANVTFNINTVDATGFDELLESRKGMITAMINNAFNARGKMGIM